MEISEITFYLSLAVMAGVLQEQLILLLLLRILRRKYFLLEVPFTLCAKVFGTESLPIKDVRFVNTTTCKRILEMRKCFSYFTTNFF